MSVCVRARVCVCVCVFARACVRVCVCMCVCVYGVYVGPTPACSSWYKRAVGSLGSMSVILRLKYKHCSLQAGLFNRPLMNTTHVLIVRGVRTSQRRKTKTLFRDLVSGLDINQLFLDGIILLLNNTRKDNMITSTRVMMIKPMTNSDTTSQRENDNGKEY